MDIRLRLLTAEIAILTAVASLFATDTEQWTKVYERRLYAEMALNLLRTGSESQTSIEDPVQPGPERKTLEGIQPKIQEGSQSEAQTQMAAEGVVSESEAVNEQTAEEEILEYSIPEALENVQPAIVQDPVEVVQQTAPVAPDPESYVCSVSCNGDALDAGVSVYLKRRLTEAGIGWFFPYACAIAYQESSFNCLAVNPNMRDYGLFQFRIEFHPGLDWQNPYAQVDLFTAMMANRAAAGCDVHTMISRHLMSDYGPYNQQYVDLVLQHLPKLQGVW